MRMPRAVILGFVVVGAISLVLTLARAFQ